jgi:antitoxin (DNA-binding transcriptional repressor) of toxin-antitoxin stability system
MLVTVPDTKKELLELIDAALSGEEVIIASESRTAIKLVPVERPRFKHGILKDVLKGPIPDFLEPMSEEELLDWEGRD